MKKTIITLLALAGVAAAETVTLTMPATKDNGGHGYISAEGAITAFANDADGGYMFNGGGAVGTNGETGEGILTTTDDGVTSLTLAPRTGAGGSGEAIVLSGSNLVGYSVDSFTFGIADSSCKNDEGTAVTADIALTLAVIKNSGSEWSVVKKTTGSLTLNSSAELTLTLTQSIDWTSSYKVVAVIDNMAKTLGGGGSPTYTMTGITMSAVATPVPEPTTATLSLLALAGLAARRRRASR